MYIKKKLKSEKNVSEPPPPKQTPWRRPLGVCVWGGGGVGMVAGK